MHEMHSLHIPALPLVSRNQSLGLVQHDATVSSPRNSANNRGSTQLVRMGPSQGDNMLNSMAPSAAPPASSSKPASVNEWEFHQKYGIIHGWYCTICQDYIAHLKHFYNHPTYQKSLGNPKGLYEAFYRDGLKEGITFGMSQVESLRLELLRKEEERKLASERDIRQNKECAELRNKVELLQKELADLQPTAVPKIVLPQGQTTIAKPEWFRATTSQAITTSSRHHHRPTLSMDISILRPRPVPLVSPISTRTVSDPADEEPPKTNPRLEDPVEIWYDYYCTHRKSWPRGVRRDIRHRPILSDLRADRAVARFRPDIAVRPPEPVARDGQELEGLPTPSPRNQFKNMIVELFSQEGLYAKHLVQFGLYVAGTTTYKTYEGPFPITMEDLVTFLAESGITPQMATTDFEPWAKNYKDGVNESIPFTPGTGSSQLRLRRR